MLGNNCKLFLYGLPPDCEENSLKDYLEAVCGVSDGVIKVSIPPGKTFGFVTLQRADIAESFLEKTLLYCDGSGDFYQVKPCRYIERQFTRPKQSNSPGTKCNYTKPAAYQVPRKSNEPTKYKSPEHVHFSPDYNMLGLSLPKKRKRKHNDGVVWFGDCGTTTKKKPKTKRKKLKKKASKLVIHKGESFQLGLVTPVCESTASEVDFGNTKTTTAVGNPLLANQELSNEETKLSSVEVSDKATESLASERPLCESTGNCNNSSSLQHGPYEQVIPEVDDGTTKTTTTVDNLLTINQESNNEEVKLSIMEESNEGTKSLDTPSLDSGQCNRNQGTPLELGLVIPGSKCTPSEVNVGDTKSTTAADDPMISNQGSSLEEVNLPTVKVIGETTKSSSRERLHMQAIIEHGYLGPLCFDVSERTTVGDIKDEIMERTGLPTGNQILTCHSKTLCDSLEVGLLMEDNQSSVTLLLCEGSLKGGVKPKQAPEEGAVGGAKDPHVEQEEASLLMETWDVNETATWMLQVGLDKKYAAVCDKESVSGRALLILASKGPERLEQIFQLKQGPLNILLDSLRSHLETFDKRKPQTVPELTKTMTTWTTEKLCSWLRGFCVSEECLKEVEEEEINGQSFVLMRNSDELLECLHLRVGPWAVLQHELALCEEICSRASSDIGKEEAAETVKSVCEPSPTLPDVEPNQLNQPASHDPSWILDYKEPLPARSLFKREEKSVLSKEDEILMQLQNALKFNVEVARSSQAADVCVVRSIFVKRGGGANALEKKLNFIAITKDEKLDGHAARQLWGKVREHTSDWMKLFTEEDALLFAEQIEELRDGPVGEIFLEKLSADEFSNNYFVILIDEQLLQKTNMCCFFTDNKEKRSFVIKLGDKGSKYHASFNKKNPSRGLKWSGDFSSLLDKMKSLPKNISAQPNVDNVSRAIDIGRFQTLRPFNCEVGNTTYTQGFVLNCLETGVKDLITPVHELKLFRKAVALGEEESIKKFVRETLRFACGCLNERTNGTIHFGVADEVETQTHGHKPREIVGVPVTNLPLFNDKLTEFIDKCFTGPSKSIVHNCVRPPCFIPVKPSSNEVVIEVDIEPRYSFCKNEIFEVGFKALGQGRQENVGYIRHGSHTQEMSQGDWKDLLKNRLPKLDEERKMRENEITKRFGRKESPRHLFVKLQRLLCANKKVLDSSIYPILVLSKPDPSMNQTFLEKNFSFLPSIKWMTIFDFDDEGSMDSGLCRIIKCGPNALQCDLHEAEDYELDPELTDNVYCKTHWIFGNGYVKVDKKAANFKQWHNSKRRQGVSRVIQSLASNIPQARAVVLFLLLSKNYQAMADTFKEFCSHLEGPNQVVYVAENSEVADDWESELCRTCLEEHELRERGVVGMSWPEFQECVQQIAYGIDKDQLYVTMTTGSLCPLKNVTFGSLDVLNAKECEELTTLSQEELEELSLVEEEKFYKGYPVTWKNFWFTDIGKNHVLRRDNYSQLKIMIETMFGSEEKVQKITLHHHIGSGASTMGRQALWDFRYNAQYPYRCARVNRFDDSTCEEILRLRRLGHREDKEVACPPVLALVEDTDEFVFRELQSQVSRYAATLARTNSPVCVFLYSKPAQKPLECHKKETKTSVCLEQRLSSKEVVWFKGKCKDMENKLFHKDPGRDFEKYASDNLISFMLMKENFNPSYAKNIVQRNLEEVTRDELTLLQYTSLLSIYDPYPVFTACFDALMLSVNLLKKGIFRNWVEDLTHSAGVFLREVDCSADAGTGRSIAIVHPVIARELLDQIAERNQITVAQIALNFLESLLVEEQRDCGTFTSKHLRDAASIMLKHRKKFEYGDDEETKFSPLIEKILYVKSSVTGRKEATEQSINQAAEVLKKGLLKFGEHVLAQQIARVFYLNASAFSEENTDSCFQKASEFCRKAMEIKPNNPFLFDTMARIQERKIKLKYDPIRKENRWIEIAGVNKLLSLSFEAIRWFQKSQAASVDCQSKSGFRGELTTIVYLLDVLRCVDIFRGQGGKEKLRQYLAFSQVIPREVETLWKDFHSSIRGLRDRYLLCMEDICEEFTIYKANTVHQISLPRQIARFKTQYHSYFGKDENLNGDTFQERWEMRWQEINQYLGGEMFFSVFSLDQAVPKLEENPRKTLQELQRLVLENFDESNYRETYKDLLLLITTTMALHSPFGDPQRRESAKANEEYKETYRYVEKLCVLEESEPRKRLYAHLFKVMFLWPRTDLELSDYRPKYFYDALEKLKKIWDSKKKDTGDPDKKLKQKMYRNMSFKTETVTKSTTLFYLGKGRGLDVFVHANEFSQFRSGKGLDWDDPRTKRRLQRLKGVVVRQNVIRVQNPLAESRTIDVYFSSFRQGRFSKEEVSFFLGFSWPQPIAFDVKYTNADNLAKDTGEFNDPMSNWQTFTRPSRKIGVLTYDEFLKLREKLHKKLEQIDTLKKKEKEGTELEENQRYKIEREEEYKKQLQELEERLDAPEEGFSD